MIKYNFKLLVKKLLGQDFKPVVYPQKVDELFELEIVFLITPGRSGTQTLVEYCIANSTLLSLHAPEVTLGAINHLYDQQRISSEAAKWCYYTSREKYLLQAFTEKKVFLDGDCKSLSILPLLAKEFPKSKFIHLVRKPASFIKSGLSRGYFTSKPSAFWGYLEDNDKTNLSQIEKIALFWNKANIIAEKMKKELPSNRIQTLIAEEMFQDGSEITKTFELLHLLNHFNAINNNNKLNVKNGQRKKINIDTVLMEEIFEAVDLICTTKDIYYK